MPAEKPPWARVPPPLPRKEVEEDAPTQPPVQPGPPPFPEHLQHRPPRARLPEKLERRKGEIQDYYQNTPEEITSREPAPKHGGRLKTVLLAAFIIMSMGGAAMAAMNFTYARGAASLATSVSFLHLEICLIFVAMVFGFVVLDWK